MSTLKQVCEYAVNGETDNLTAYIEQILEKNPFFSLNETAEGFDWSWSSLYLGPCTPLMAAAKAGKYDVCKTLIEQFKVDINYLGARHQDYTALDCAKEYGDNSELISYLESKGAKQKYELISVREVCKAVRLGDIDSVEAAISQGIDLDRTAEWFDDCWWGSGFNILSGSALTHVPSVYLGACTPLMVACAYNQLKMVKVLLSPEKVNPNVSYNINAKGGRNLDHTALDCAVRWGSPAIRKMILDKNGKLASTDRTRCLFDNGAIALLSASEKSYAFFNSRGAVATEIATSAEIGACIPKFQRK